MEQLGKVNCVERVPLLFVDVNLGRDKIERIIIYEGDTSDMLAANFIEE